ncbi:DUF5110 domain-containing protein [Pedobacter sp. BS3]|nr:DUF5110 domain-containing protein [Pedobacter sp. BS3]
MQALANQYNPVADPAAIVKASANVRFTVLTPQLIRMEWNEKGIFNDHASFLVVNRKLPVPAYHTRTESHWFILETSGLELRYKLNSGKFDSSNLSISLKPGRKIKWVPGMVQQQNLKGTARTLDRFDGDSNVVKKQRLKLEDGVLARDGWTLFDDSKNFLLDESDWPWVMERKDKNGLDWYFLGYKSDYKQALYDYTQIAGKEPLPPRYAFGYWWSRYWSYSDNELRDVVNHFERYDIPLDVLVLDMDWHNTDSIHARPDEFGQRKWWTGWTWNKRLFPDPEKFLQWAHGKKIKTTLNLHPASGIAPFESQYSAFARRMNFDTTSRRNIPFEGSNKKFMQTLFDVVLRPMEKQGVDFWWLDWQQWLEDKKIKGLQNTWWLNYAFFTDMEKNRDTRPILYHRWGGLGNHRYQVGLSGDVIISWKSLEYQPYFTNTASNVLYGYWSHDIGGHTYGKQGIGIDPELQTRWVQYGALNPIFRTHSSKNPLLTKEPWSFKGAFFDAQYDAIKLRYMLLPYIYTMARYAYDTGISLCRPMYYDYPKKEEAYQFDRQYMFGNDILVAPIGSPMVNGFSTVNVWLPEGNDWYEWPTGTLLKGGQIVQREFSIDEYPIYIKAGALIPMYGDEVKNLSSNPDRIKLGIFPGSAGSARMYEDAGNNKDYASQYAYTNFTSTVLPDGSLQVVIEPVKGTYAGMKPKRNYLLSFYGYAVPERVTVNGEEFTYQDTAAKGWHYNSTEMSANISIPGVAINKKTIIKLNFGLNTGLSVNNGLKEKFKRLSRVTTELKNKDANIVIPVTIGNLEETNRRLEYNPEQFKQIIRQFNADFPKIPETLKSLGLDKATETWCLSYLGFR